MAVTGYAGYFTHRLGHGAVHVSLLRFLSHLLYIGIGLEVHEGPYLNGGSEDVLDTGHTFSDEPGIYIEGKVSTFSCNESVGL
jgi:Xaa-Pro aminopeptidase